MARKALLILSVLLLLALSSASLVTLAQPTNNTGGPDIDAPPPGGGHPMGPCLARYIKGHPCPTNQDPNANSYGHQPPPPPIRQSSKSNYITYGALNRNLVKNPNTSKCRYCTHCPYNCRGV